MTHKTRLKIVAPASIEAAIEHVGCQWDRKWVARVVEPDDIDGYNPWNNRSCLHINESYVAAGGFNPNLWSEIYRNLAKIVFDVPPRHLPNSPSRHLLSQSSFRALDEYRTAGKTWLELENELDGLIKHNSRVECQRAVMDRGVTETSGRGLEGIVEGPDADAVQAVATATEENEPW